MQTETLALIRFKGSDAPDFIDRIFTQSIQNLSGDQFRFAAFCTPKGRVIANGLFLKYQDGYNFVLHASLLTKVSTTLQRYIMRSDVILESDLNIPVSIQSRPEHALEKTHDETIFHGEGVFSNYQLILNSNDSASDWKAAAIQAALAIIGLDESEKHLPQTLNMDLAQGVDFKKGCYPGQEVVARLHYLGNSKQRCYPITSSAAVSSGLDVLPDSTSEKPQGRVVLAHSNGTALMTYHCSHAKQTHVFIRSTDSSELIKAKIEQPPYALEGNKNGS